MTFRSAKGFLETPHILLDIAAGGLSGTRDIRSGQHVWNIGHTGERPSNGVLSFSAFCPVEVSAGGEERPVYHHGAVVDWVGGYRTYQVTLALTCAAYSCTINGKQYWGLRLAFRLNAYDLGIRPGGGEINILTSCAYVMMALREKYSLNQQQLFGFWRLEEGAWDDLDIMHGTDMYFAKFAMSNLDLAQADPPERTRRALEIRSWVGLEGVARST
jgi:hypothetical protein